VPAAPLLASQDVCPQEGEREKGRKGEREKEGEGEGRGTGGIERERENVVWLTAFSAKSNLLKGVPRSPSAVRNNPVNSLFSVLEHKGEGEVDDSQENKGERNDESDFSDSSESDYMSSGSSDIFLLPSPSLLSPLPPSSFLPS
jgi:hypothetical protein